MLGVLTSPMFVFTGCRAQGNMMRSGLPPRPSSACREGLLHVFPFPAPCKGLSSDGVSSKHVPSRAHSHMSARASLWDDKPRYSSVQTSFREKRKDQRQVTGVVTPLHALLDNISNPQQLQLGNGNCVNRTAQSSIPGSIAPSLEHHNFVQARWSSLHLPQPGYEMVVQTPGRHRHVRMTTSLLHGNRLPARHPARSPVSQCRQERPAQEDPLGFSPSRTTCLPKWDSPKSQLRLREQENTAQQPSTTPRPGQHSQILHLTAAALIQTEYTEKPPCLLWSAQVGVLRPQQVLSWDAQGLRTGQHCAETLKTSRAALASSATLPSPCYRHRLSSRTEVWVRSQHLSPLLLTTKTSLAVLRNPALKPVAFSS